MEAALAVSLIGQRRSFDEAFAHLQRAVIEFPLARLLAAYAFSEIGWREEAVNQVSTYLISSANPCERAALETWIAAESRMAVPGVERIH